MLSRGGLVRRIAAFVVLAALVIAGAVAWNYHPMPAQLRVYSKAVSPTS